MKLLTSQNVLLGGRVCLIHKLDVLNLAAKAGDIHQPVRINILDMAKHFDYASLPNSG